MPTIIQLFRNIRQPKKNVKKSPALKGCPQRHRFPTPSNFRVSKKTRLEKIKQWRIPNHC